MLAGSLGCVGGLVNGSFFTHISCPFGGGGHVGGGGAHVGAGGGNLLPCGVEFVCCVG